MSSLTCIDCGKQKERRRASRCWPCTQHYDKWMHAANRAITRARARGLIGAASEQQCVDCGRQAFDWDHRDYTKPLHVEPVCRSCNGKRGPALFPLDRTPEPAQAA